jgi:hypothetical protein
VAVDFGSFFQLTKHFPWCQRCPWMKMLHTHDRSRRRRTICTSRSLRECSAAWWYSRLSPFYPFLESADSFF